MKHRADGHVQLQTAFVNEWRHEESWLGKLPRLVEECARKWHLDFETPFDTPHSLVVPAGDVVLKLNAPSHCEAEFEADALAAWSGEGAVRLIYCDSELRALVIERCIPGIQLWNTDVDSCEIVGNLLPRLLVPAPTSHPFRSLTAEAARWHIDVPHWYARAGLPFEQPLLDRALETFASTDGTARWLVNQDLHGGNILSAQRDPWLVIDPKPLVGEAELNAVGLLRNAAWREGTAGVRRWLDALQGLGLDRERMQDWGLAHALAWGWDEYSGWSSASVEAARIIAAA